MSDLVPVSSADNALVPAEVPAGSITLTDRQGNAVKAIATWFDQCQRELADGLPLSKQIFRLFGYAGTGKTEILKHAMAELGVMAMPKMPSKATREEKAHARDEIRFQAQKSKLALYGSFTGKAALVMTRKGAPATTIHSMVYSVQEPSAEAIKEACEELAKLRENGPGATDQLLWRAMLRDRENQIKNMHRPIFVINPDSMITDAALIVLDEVSMVNDEMGADVLAFGRPVLVVGDPGQLPPIKGEGAFTNAAPDIMLTEIHRQAEGSAIIRLATMARKGQHIAFGQYSDLVYKCKKESFHAGQYLTAGQVLCGFNATRIGLNNSLKMVAGFPEPLPIGNGEKIICLKNRAGNGLINGQFLALSEIDDASDLSFMADVATEDGDDVGRLPIYRGHFDDHLKLDKERGERDYFKKKGMVECVWGYAITVHKAQGSQWENVIVYDDGFGRGEDRARWLYTAITRAESGLLILA